MALVKCPECQKEISDHAKYCIHCGYQIDQIIHEYRKKITLHFRSIEDLSEYSCMEMPQLGIVSGVDLCAVVDTSGLRKIHFYLSAEYGIFKGPECDLVQNYDALLGAILSDYKYFENIILSGKHGFIFPQQSYYSNYLRKIHGCPFDEAIRLIKKTTFAHQGIWLDFEQFEYPDEKRNYNEWAAQQLKKKSNRAYPSPNEWQINFAPSRTLEDMRIAIWNSKMNAPCVATEGQIIEFSNELKTALEKAFF
jgi:hypothetical protein